ncbi:uncharacterized protein LOC111042803 [Myzus persicae]|uniref:uncharacterized protein LOC111042803 n=1 Tax=Myzus persicae TaxID=13164 RepID=UPI000B935775|nr:uncharacterized protein LOC111042803 [Myzus persicae]
MPEVKPVKFVLSASQVTSPWLLESYSDWMKFLRISALVMRFISNCRTMAKCKENRCLKQLSPFIDEAGLIRVGGRLMNASISNSMKYPIVLPSASQVTRLLFKYEHIRLLHVGPLALFVSPFMAPLPRERVTIARPFARTGVDYCGPVMVPSGLRKVTPLKSYLCVFICLVTRAIHLELVASLPANESLSTLSSRGIDWHFIPPSAPHFGGIWEAAVKSAKKHLLLVAKGVMMTFYETTTLLCRIEAVLNSWPLTPLSSDPSNFNALKAGHFLIGGSLQLPPEPAEPDCTGIPQNRLR